LLMFTNILQTYVSNESEFLVPIGSKFKLFQELEPAILNFKFDDHDVVEKKVTTFWIGLDQN
jgi:hypothetical protein